MTARRTTDRPLLPEEARDLPRLPLVAVLEDLRSAFNVGSIFRTADAVRWGAIVLAGFTGRPPHPKIAKTALGAEEAVPWWGAPDAPSALEFLRARGFHLAAVEQTGRSTSLWEAELPRPLALVFGNEVTGVSGPALALCEQHLEIPTQGVKNSINVATAFGIVAYEIWRRWGGTEALTRLLDRFSPVFPPFQNAGDWHTSRSTKEEKHGQGEIRT